MTSASASPRPANPRRRSARIAFVVFLLAAAAVFVPDLASMDMMRGGYAIAFVCGFVALSALVVAILLRRSAARLDAILSGDDVLAVWTIDAGEWSRFVAADRELEAAEKRALFRLVAVITVAVGLGFVGLMRDEASIQVFAGLMAFLGLLFVVSRAGRGAYARRFLGSPVSVFVSRRGVLLDGDFHDFELADTRIDGAGIRREQGLTMLEVAYSWADTYGPKSAVVRVPVPAGAEKDAERVAEALRAEA